VSAIETSAIHRISLPSCGFQFMKNALDGNPAFFIFHFLFPIFTLVKNQSLASPLFLNVK
jgi:hypothetical protein